MSEIQNNVAQPLNLVALARANPKGSAVPGTKLEAIIVEQEAMHELPSTIWLMVIQGELIIDLPYGDFRLLKKGDSLHLEKGTKVSFEPLKEVVALRQVA